METLRKDFVSSVQAAEINDIIEPINKQRVGELSDRDSFGFSTTESEESENEKEYIFKSLSKRTPSTVLKVSHSIYSVKEESKDARESTDHSPENSSSFWTSLFEIPFRYFLNKGGDSERPVPLIFPSLKANISDSLIEGKHFYEISIAYGTNLSWKVYRRLRDLVKLHSLLTFKHMKDKNSIPRLPAFPKQVIRGKKEESFRFLEGYLRELFNTMGVFPCIELCEFLEISSFSLKHSLGMKGKEGYMKLKIYETRPRWSQLLCACLPEPYSYTTRWIIFTKSALVFIDRLNQIHPSDVFLFDADFSYSLKNDSTLR